MPGTCRADVGVSWKGCFTVCFAGGGVGEVGEEHDGVSGVCVCVCVCARARLCCCLFSTLKGTARGGEAKECHLLAGV